MVFCRELYSLGVIFTLYMGRIKLTNTIGVKKVGKNFYQGGLIESNNRHLLEIGDDVILGGDSKIILHCPISSYKPNPEIILEDMVWIGYDCAILPSTKIGRMTIVGLKSIVSGSIPPYSIFAGRKVIRKRDIGELLNYYLIRKLKANGNKQFGIKTTNWDLLTMDHIKMALGYNTEYCYDDKLDFDLKVEDFISKYAGDWPEITQ